MLIRNTKVTESQLDRLRGLIAQPKLDGIRVVVYNYTDGFGNEYTEIRTRGNKPLRKELEEWILKVLNGAEKNRFIDCELIYDNDCAATSGIAHSIHTTVNYDKLRLFVFDVVELDNRQEPLDSRLARNTPAIINVPSWKHVSFEDSYSLAKQWADLQGVVFEGFVLKPSNSVYQFGKRLDGSYKYKLQAEMEVVVEQVLPMEDMYGNDKPLAGYFVCRLKGPKGLSTGTRIRVTASCSNELRTAMWNRAEDVIGKEIKIRYMNVQSGKSNTGLVRMPRYLSGLEFLLEGES
jgi:ATP-dependent DNA ligase